MKNFSAWENNRNAENRKVYGEILKEVFGKDDDTLIAHHLCFSLQEGDKFTVQEIPSADTMIFDHDVAKVLWGKGWEKALTTLALTPVDRRDAELTKMYYGRVCNEYASV